MKNFFISTALFAVLIVLIIVNSIYLRSQTEELSDHISKLTATDIDSFQNSYDNARSQWQDLKAKAKLTCYRSEISSIDILFEQLQVHFDTKSRNDFESAKRTLIINLRELTRLEKAIN